MKDMLESIAPFAIFILVVWLFAPSSFAFSDNVKVYPVKLKFCNQFSVCDVSEFLPVIQLRVDTSKSEVVWRATNNNQIGVWQNCTIADKYNWDCSSPIGTMKDGYLLSSDPDIKYISGWSYKLYWLISFLPSLR